VAWQFIPDTGKRRPEKLVRRQFEDEEGVEHNVAAFAVVRCLTLILNSPVVKALRYRVAPKM